jgi:hypothetical protein
MHALLITTSLLWGATSHPSSNLCPASSRSSAMLDKVAYLPWSALYALQVMAYFGAAGFLLVANRLGGARWLLYSLWVFGHPALLAQCLSRLAILLQLALALSEYANLGSASCGSSAPKAC